MVSTKQREMRVQHECKPYVWTPPGAHAPGGAVRGVAWPGAEVGAGTEAGTAMRQGRGQ